MTLMPYATAEREDFLALLEGLSPEQWERPTLCADWSVREVVAHVLSFEDLSMPAALWTIVRGRLGKTSANDLALAPYRDLAPGQLVDRMRAHLVPRGLTAGFQGGIALSDGMIHQQDIRRPLGIPRHIPRERVVGALAIALQAPTLPSRRRVKGLELRATDVEWSHGDGPQLCGPSEALLMAIAGRVVAAEECSGPGLDEWRSRT